MRVGYSHEGFPTINPQKSIIKISVHKPKKTRFTVWEPFNFISITYYLLL